MPILAAVVFLLGVAGETAWIRYLPDEESSEARPLELFERPGVTFRLMGGSPLVSSRPE